MGRRAVWRTSGDRSRSGRRPWRCAPSGNGKPIWPRTRAVLTATALSRARISRAGRVRTMRRSASNPATPPCLAGRTSTSASVIDEIATGTSTSSSASASSAAYGGRSSRYMIRAWESSARGRSSRRASAINRAMWSRAAGDGRAGFPVPLFVPPTRDAPPRYTDSLIPRR
jgi:hypothetical protein